MPKHKVTKCICHDRSFIEIKEYARENEITTLKELQKKNYCSCSCGLCGPYIELLLDTGEIEFAPGAYYRRKG